MEELLSFTGARRTGVSASAIVAILAPLALLGAQPASAASFDCAKAGMGMEIANCADAEGPAVGVTIEIVSQRRLAPDAPTDGKDTVEGSAAGTAGKQASSVVTHDFEISKGAESELCTGLERGLREHGLIPIYGKICGVPFPEGVETFERIHWQDMDPSENLTLLKQILYWSNLDRKNFGTDFKRQLNSPEIIPELFNRIIGPVEAQIAELLAAGAIKLQVSRFDVDNDEAVETVYRMSAIRLRGRYHPVWIPENSCKVTVKGWEDRPLNYLVVKAGVQHPLEGRGHAASHLYYFRHQGVTYSSASDFTISKLKPIKDMPRFATVVCGFRTLEGE